MLNLLPDAQSHLADTQFYVESDELQKVIPSKIPYLEESKIEKEKKVISITSTSKQDELVENKKCLTKAPMRNEHKSTMAPSMFYVTFRNLGDKRIEAIC